MKKTINKKSVAPLSVLTKIFAGILALNFAVISPAVYAIGASPLRHVLKAKPGETVEAAIIVTNTSDSKILVTGEKADFVMTETEDLKFYNEANPENIYSLQNWISFVENDIPVEANEQTELKYKITIPKDAASHAYYGVVYVGGKNPPSTDETTGGIGVGLQTQVAHLVLLEVEGDLKTSLELTDYYVEKPEAEENTLNFITKYYNSGNTHQAPGGKIIITDAEKYSLMELEVNKGKYNNLPELPKTVVTQYKPEELKPGVYYAYYLAIDASGKEIAAELKFEITNDKTVNILETNMGVKYIAPEPKAVEKTAGESTKQPADYSGIFNYIIFGIVGIGLIGMAVLYFKINKKNKPHKHILQIKKHKKEHKKVHHKKNKKKKIFKIFTLLIAIFAGFETANTTLAAAQEASDLTLSTTVDDFGDCIWSGTPWASTLIVPDDAKCYIEGTGRTATAVDVQADTNGGQLGGWLVVGSNNMTTEFAVSGNVDIKGILDVGYDSGNPVQNSTLSTTSGGDLNINTGGVATVRANSGGSNTLTIVDQINVGDATTTGTLNYQDATTNTGNQLIVYGLLTVSDATLNITTSGIGVYGSGQISNNATITNGGALVMNTNGVINNVGSFTASSFVSMTGNSNIVNGSTATFNLNAATTSDAFIILNSASSVDNAGTFTVKGHIVINDTSDFTNDDAGNPSTLTVDDSTTYVNYIQLNNSATFNNNTGATTTVGKDTTVDGEIRLYNTSVFTNNSTVNTDKTFLQGDAEALVSRSKIDNNATFNTNRLRSGNDALWGGLFYGKSGSTLNVDGSGDSVYITNAGRIINESGGQIIIDGNVADVTGKNTTADTQKSILSNASTTGSAFTVTGNTTINNYSKIDNTGTFNADDQVTLNGDANITNGSSATFDIIATTVAEGDITMNSTSTFTNAGVLDISDVFLIQDTASFTNSDPGSTATLNLRNSAGTTTVYRQYGTSTFYNGGIGDASGQVVSFNGTYAAIYTTDKLVDSIFYNYGTWTYDTGAVTRLYIGSGTNIGGTFNNYNIFQLNTSGNGNLYMETGGIFNNESDATASARNLYLSTASLPGSPQLATYNQKQGTNGNTKTTFTFTYIYNYGKFVNLDKISGGTLYMYAGSIFEGGDAPGTIASTSTFGGGLLAGATFTIYATSSTSFAGAAQLSSSANITIDGTATFSSLVNAGTNTTLTINGTGNFNGTTTNNVRINASKFYSGNDSIINFSTATPSIELNGASPFVELAGDVTGQSIYVARANGSTDLSTGYLCIGNYTGTYPTGSCDNVSGKTTTLNNTTNSLYVYNNAASGTATVEIANNLTFSGLMTVSSDNTTRYATVTQKSDAKITGSVATSDILVQNYNTVFTSNGEIDLTNSHLKVNEEAMMSLNYTGVNEYDMGAILITNGTNISQPAKLTVADNAIVELNNYESCDASNCALGVGTTTGAGTALLNNYGTINITSASNGNIVIGAASGGGGDIVVKSDTSLGDGYIHDTTTGSLTVLATGQLFVERRSSANFGEVAMGGLCDLYGDGSGTNGDRGANVNGKLTCTNSLHLYSGGSMDVGFIKTLDYVSQTVDFEAGETITGPSGASAIILADNDTGTSGTLTLYDFNYNHFANNEVITGDKGGSATTPAAGETDTYEARGEVYVAGSTTTIDDFMELDGLLDTGTDNGDTLTVTSTGLISSGVGIESYFEILAHDLTIDSGGKISSDNVSTNGINYNSYGGSYGGEGIGRGTGNTTYGPAKFTWNGAAWSATPLYGERGLNGGGSTGTMGGGAVRIRATGDILNNGKISADGGTNLLNSYETGSGGTVVIIHDIDHSDTSNIFSGTGTISANGGDSGSDGGGNESGGGGRVVIDSILFDDPNDGTGEYDFTGNVSARGGIKYLMGTDEYAAAGTIVLLGDDNNPNGTLIVDQDPVAEGVGAATGSPQPETYVTATGDYVFNRMEARNAAVINFATAPATSPVSCYDIDGTITNVTACAANPDKPPLMYINNSVTGAQSAAEPSGATPLSVGDLTPNFSAIYANPEDATAVSRVHIQVAEDTDTDGILFESGDDTFKWDTTTGSPITISPSITPTQRSQDIEYAGTALSADTVYYVRLAFMDSTNTNRGLWTHRDMGNQYKFIIQNYLDIYPNCVGNEIVIEDANHAGSNIQNAPTRRFGSGSCEMDFLSAVGGATNWYIHFGMASSEGSNQAIAFNDQANNSGNDIAPIVNATKCTMDTTGNTSIEEYAFNISAPSEGTASNDSDGTCTGAFTTGYHDVELYSALNQIISGLGATTGLYDTFNLNLFANVSGLTVPSSTYTLDMSFIITTTP